MVKRANKVHSSYFAAHAPSFSTNSGGMNDGHPVSEVEMLNVKDKVWTELREEPPWPLGPCSACIVGNRIYFAGQ